MNVCHRCDIECEITYTCEHTKCNELCKECYQYIHWAIYDDSDMKELD